MSRLLLHAALAASRCSLGAGALLPAAAAASSSRLHAGAAAAAAAPPQPPQPLWHRGHSAAASSTEPSSSSQPQTSSWWGEPSQREARALLSAFNVAAVPGLAGHMLLAKVLRRASDELLVDPGYYGLCRVSARELGSAATYNADGTLRERGGSGVGSPDAAYAAEPARIGPGDYVRLRLTQRFTPYGDAQLEAVAVPKAVRDKLVWKELRARMRGGRPVAGRILNACPGGYAVGVGGYVALLRHGQGSVERVSRIAALQPFYVHRMDERARTVELSNFSSGGGGGGGGGSGGGGRAGGGAGGGTIYSNI